MPTTVQPVPMLADNYAWLLRAPDGTLALCDPPDAEAGARAVDAAGGRLAWIWLTHHHGDHIAGAAALRERYGARIAGASADAHRLPPLDLPLAEGDTIAFAEGARVIATPGHTSGHIAYHLPESAILLCGDTLFSIGCGRLLEGTPEQMFASLAKLAALPDATRVCCGHEYTEANIRFALTVEPDNAALQARARDARAERAAGRPTVPSTIGAERAANPFLRAGNVAAFAALRAAKDRF